MQTSLHAQVVINEILPGGTVELKNIGNTTIDVSSYWLCDFPAYQQIQNSNLQCGNPVMAPGDILTVDNFNTIDENDGEMGLYSTNSFGSSAAIVDYVEWGSAGHRRATVAAAAGIWTNGTFVPAFGAGESLAYDGEGDAASDWSAAPTPTICEENTDGGCDVDGGEITTNDATVICVDRNPDPIDVSVSGSRGTLGGWIITDDANNILALPANPPFDLDGAGVGTCIIWYIRYEDGLTGKAAGNNLSDLDGCFDLSNGITVIREAPDGGRVSLLNGDTTYANCAGTIAFDVQHTTASPNLSYWYIITDNNDNILAWVNSANSNSLDLSAAPAGECHVWGWNYRGLGDPIVGDHISTLADDDCEDISDNWITVFREVADGGMVDSDFGTETTICVDGTPDPIVVSHTTTAPNLSYWYIITDDNDNILAWSTNPVIDLDGAGVGTCRIWGWNYRGLPDPVVGDPISSLNDDDCESISENFITVNRVDDGSICGDVNCDVDGGEITTNDATVICVDGNADPIDVAVSGSRGTNGGWIITDDANNILALPANPPFDLDGAGVGTCIIWYIRYEDGLTGKAAGNNLSDLDGCFDLSNGITVIREAADGGMVSLSNGATSYANCAGDIVFDVQHTTAAPNLSYWYIITDNNDNILAWVNSANSNTLDLSAAPAGECHVWGWSYRGLDDPIVGDHISTLNDDDCEAISDNWITVYREVADGGTVNSDFGTETTICVDGTPDPIVVSHTTTAPNLSYWYIITDDNDNILAWSTNPVIDLDGAGVGTCRIWGWNYRGLPDPVVGDPISSLNDDDCESISENFITVNRVDDGSICGDVNCDVDGGEITTNDATVICVDGNADPIDVTVSGSRGTNGGWIITDDANNILALPANPPFDLDGAGVGTCIIWYIRYEDGLTGKVAGNNLSDLDGCFDLSNGITVIREAADGGMVSLSNGATSYANCAGDIVFDVQHTTAAPNLSYWYIITDNNDNILAWVNSANSNTLDLSAAPAGECHVWGWSYRGLDDPIVGEHISTLNDDDCEAISDNWITVYREVADGGTVTSDFGTETTICVDGTPDPIVVSHTTTAPNLSYWYIITDDNDNILAWSTNPVIDLDGAGVGTCRIWGWNYRGLPDPVVGDPISSLNDDDCESISDNFITVNRVENGPACNPASGADVELSITADNLLYKQYENVVYTIEVSNNGTETATNVNVAAGLPQGLVFTNSTVSAGEYNLFFENWYVGTLAPGQTEYLKLELFTLIGDVEVTNFVQVMTMNETDADSQPGNDTDQTVDEDDEAAVTIAPASGGGLGGGEGTVDLELSVSLPNAAYDNFENLLFTLTLTNNGPDDATGIVVNAAEPANTVFAGGNTPASISHGTFNDFFEEWTIDVLRSGETATLVLDLFTLGGKDPINFFSEVFIANENDSDSTPGNGGTGQGATEDDEASLVVAYRSSNIVNASNRLDNSAQNTTAIDVLLFPNPASDRMTLSTTSASDRKVTYRIINTAGQVVGQNAAAFVKGYNELELEVDHLDNGIYFLQVIGSDRILNSLRFSKISE